MALGIDKQSKAVAWTEKELKKAAKLDVELPALSHHKIELPEVLKEELQTALDTVLDSFKERILTATGDLVDAKNGAGYSEILLGMHTVQCSLYSAKNQNKAHKLLAVATDEIPASVLEAEAGAAAPTSDIETVEVEI